jgi:hypothetical protein
MRRILLGGIVLLSLAPFAAQAQVSQSSDSNGQSTATSIIEEGGGSGNGSGSSGQDYGDKHGNNVDAVAPTMYSNDSCGQSAAAGASFLGIGISGGLTGEIQGCVKRQWFILTMTAAQKLSNPAFAQWGINIACSVSSIAASAPPGMCPTTGAPAAVTPVVATSVARPSEYPVSETNVATPSSPVARPPAEHPDWCDTWSKGDGSLPSVCR